MEASSWRARRGTSLLGGQRHDSSNQPDVRCNDETLILTRITLIRGESTSIIMT